MAESITRGRGQVGMNGEVERERERGAAQKEKGGARLSTHLYTPRLLSRGRP